MTTEERAEKLARHFEGMTFSGGLGTAWLITQIAAEIRAGVEDGRNEIRRACSQHQHEQFSDGFKAGKAEAYEDAAKILEATKWKDAQDSISQAWNMKMDTLALLLRARAKDLASKSVGDEKGAEQNAE